MATSSTLTRADTGKLRLFSILLTSYGAGKFPVRDQVATINRLMRELYPDETSAHMWLSERAVFLLTGERTPALLRLDKRKTNEDDAKHARWVRVTLYRWLHKEFLRHEAAAKRRQSSEPTASADTTQDAEPTNQAAVEPNPNNLTSTVGV